MHNDNVTNVANPFYVKDCVVATIALGSRAQSIGEFRDRLKTIPAESIYYHFWRQIMEASLVPGAYYNDFSNWAHYQLHDDVLAERLALLNPSEYAHLELLRQEIIEILENRLDEQENLIFSGHDQAFYFIRSKIVVIDTPYCIREPQQLAHMISQMSISSIFYHFIDAHRRNAIALDDFSIWLHDSSSEFEPLIAQLKSIDPYFIPLVHLQKKLIHTVNNFFSGH